MGSGTGIAGGGAPVTALRLSARGQRNPWRLAAFVIFVGTLGWYPTTGRAQGISFTSPAAQQIVHPGTSFTVTLSNTDTNASGDVGQTWAVSANPAHGALSFPSGTCPTSSSFSSPPPESTWTCPVTYTLTSASYTGSDSFTMTATDSLGSTASVTVNVTVYPSPPTASNFTVQTNNAAPIAWDLAKNQDITYDSTVPVSQVILTITSPPAHGSASVSGTTITYTPSATFTGSDAIGYQVSDGSTQNASATMTVTVQQSTASIPSDVIGKTQAAGVAELTGDGFVVTSSSQVSASFPAGQIINTQPAPGTLAPRGSTINVIVSQGPGPASATPISSVPGLTMEQVAAARGLEQTCEALASADTSGTNLTAKQQDLLNKCTAIIADYSGGANVPGLQETLNAVSGRQVTAAARIPMQFAAGQVSNIAARLAAIRGGDQGINLAGLDMGAPGGAEAAFAPLANLVKTMFDGNGAGGETGGSAANGASGGRDAGSAGDNDDSGGLFGNRLGIFLNGTLRRGTETSSDAESGFDFKNSGATLGMDYRLGNSYVLGVAGGYGKSTTDFDDDGGRLDAKHVSVSLYGSYFTDHFHLDWLAGFGHNSYEIGRDIEYSSSSMSVGCDGSSCATDASGSTGARVYSLSLASGGDFHVDALEFGPTVGLDYRQVAVDSYVESGPSGLDLAFGGMTADSLVSNVGGYASYAWKTRWAVILPQVRVRYLHEFMNGQRTESVEFAADTLPGASSRSFNVYTDAPDRNYFDWQASLLFQFPYGIAGFIDYGGIAGLQNMSMHELNVGLRIER